MSETVQHSSASGSTVWLVYEYTPRVISHALSHAMSYNHMYEHIKFIFKWRTSSSTRMRMSSTMPSVG